MAHRSGGPHQRRQAVVTDSTAADITAMTACNCWVGLGVIADNLINIGNATAAPSVT